MSYVCNTLLLELHVDDFEKVKVFYAQLGFKVMWERLPEGFKGYLVMSDGHNTLCFWGGNTEIYKHEYFGQYSDTTKRGYGIEIVLMVEALDEVYEKAKQYAKIVEELQLKPWRLRDFRMEDPFGFYLRITTFHDIHDPSNAVV